MTELWAVVGCAVIDREFRSELHHHISSGASLENFMEYMLGTWGFRLSRFEADQTMKAFNNAGFMSAISGVDSVGLWETPCCTWISRKSGPASGC